MDKYIMSEEEQTYLASYDISAFDRPSVAADMAVFSIMEKRNQDGMGEKRDLSNYRKDPLKQLKLLLIRRASFPYKNAWALPGGFCRKEESVSETARRELYEETGVSDAYLRPFDIFSEEGRDPRGWIISHAFLALINGEKYRVHEGSDAWEARWFQIEVENSETSREISNEQAQIERTYSLRLICEDADNLCLTATVKEFKSYEQYHETVKYEIINCSGLAFDHARIILCAYLALQKEAGNNGTIVFDLMPEQFTLTELQRAFESVLGKPLLVANFRRKIGDYVLETDDIVDGVGHRPAKLFRRNVERFYE